MNFQNPRFVLIVIALLFFTPLLLAILMRSSWWGFEPASYTNHGKLVDPPLALPLDGLDVQHPVTMSQVEGASKWVMLYAIPGDCNDRCSRDITALRQIHLATGRNQSRVAIWLISPLPVNPDTLKDMTSIYSEFTVIADPQGVSGDTLRSISEDPGAGQEFWSSGQAFLLDPAANIILRYVPGFEPEDISRDLKRLLKWSGRD